MTSFLLISKPSLALLVESRPWEKILIVLESVINLLFRSKFPPSCGVVSSTISLIPEELKLDQVRLLVPVTELPFKSVDA